MFKWTDGRLYIGEWVNGKQNGKGTYILSNGEKRVGEWRDGIRINWYDEKESEAKLDNDNNDNRNHSNDDDDVLEDV